jgi:hypothetical protein
MTYKMALGLTQFLTKILKSGSLNLLEPSGPVQSCKLMALPLPHLNSLACNYILKLLNKILNRCHTLSSLAYEDGTDILFRNVGN